MKELFTRKIYYKKYDHRLAIKTRKSQLHKSVPNRDIIEWILNSKFKGSWRGVASSSGSSWYRTHKPLQNIYTVFFKDPAIFEYLEKTIGLEHFEEFEKPIDEAHSELLEREKVVTRKQLFHRRYRFVFRIPAKFAPGRSRFSTTHLDEMEAWCKKQFGRASENRDKYYIQRWSTGTFYFAQASDAVMFKMVWSDNIGVSERVVLVSELEAARAPTDTD